MQRETSILDDVYEKLQDEANAADIEALHLTDALAKAKEANDAYNALYVERTRTMNTRNVSANMKQLRPQTDEAFRQLALAINSYYMVNSLSTKDAEKEAAALEDYQQHERTALPARPDCPHSPGIGFERERRQARAGTGTHSRTRTHPPEITAVYQKEEVTRRIRTASSEASKPA